MELRTAEAKILIDLGMPLDYDTLSPEEQAQVLEETKAWCKGVDALLLSHAHADHYGLLDLLPEGTAIYATEETFAMLALDGILFEDKSARLKRCTLEGYVSQQICGITVTAYPVDHSAYGACALLFEADQLRVLYSGDLRTHGVKGVLYKNLPRHVDYLLLEGTNIARSGHNPTEREVERRFIKAFDDAPEALHLVWCSAKNIDRLCALFRAALQRGRTMLIDPYTANVLAGVAKLNPKIPTATTAEQIKVYFPRRITKLLIQSDKKRYIYSLNPEANKVTYDDIAASPERYVMVVRKSALEFLRNIKAEHICFIRSIWGGYWNNESCASLRSWVEANCESVVDIHSSGHADIASLRRIVDFICPKHLIPIHSDAPERFSELFTEVKIDYLDDGESIEL